MKAESVALLFVLGFVFALLFFVNNQDQDWCNQCEGETDYSFLVVSIFFFFAAFIGFLAVNAR